MKPRIQALPVQRVPAAVRLRCRLLPAVVIGVVSVVVTACGGGDDGSPSAQQTGITVTVPDEVAEANAAARDSRPGAGIGAAGGTVEAGEPCTAPGSAGAAETAKIALIAPDVLNLGVVGLEDLVFDDPAHVIDAYVNRINSLGGLNGHCFEFHGHMYGFTDPVGDFGRICTEVPQQEPLVLLVLGADDTTLQCATLGAQIPSIGLYAQYPEATFAQAGGLLRVDHGAVEFLLENGMEAAVTAGVLTTADSVALLHQAESVAPAGTEMSHDMGEAQAFGGHMHDPGIVGVAVFDATSQRLDLQVAGWVGVVEDFSGTGVLVIEQQFRDLGGDVFDPDVASFERVAALMPPDVAQLLGAMRDYFIDTAVEMRDAGVTAVVATGDWADVHNFMRAAEFAEWHPKWIINDAHYAMLVLTGVPKAQGLNLVQVSSRRAAGDPIDGLDRGCLSLRNTDTAADLFAYRFHTDAWNLLTSTCDYLDVVFSAVSRVDGPLTRDSFVAALSETSYEAAHGQSLRFSAEDLYGSDSFRVLGADPDCVLNEWGCMRPLTGWFEPATAAAGGN